MTANPAFHPDISWNALMNGWKHYLWEMFYDRIAFGKAQVNFLYVDRAKTMATAPDTTKQKEYLHVFTLTDREIREMTLESGAVEPVLGPHH